MALDPHRRSTTSEYGFAGSPGSTGLRIGDAEREQAVQALGEHLRAGRLTVVEYDERLERAFAARTDAELTPLFADLPGGAPRSTPPPPPMGRAERRARRTMAVPLRLVVVLGLIAAAIVATVVTAFPVLLLMPVLWLVVRHRFGPRHRYGPRRHYDYAGPRRY
jgi:hypothetical protein